MHDGFCDRVNQFLVDKLYAQFSEVNGIGFGIPFGIGQEILQLPKEEQKKKVQESLCFLILTKTELSEAQKQEIYQLIGERFFKITTVGEIVPL